MTNHRESESEGVRVACVSLYTGVNSYPTGDSRPSQSDREDNVWASQTGLYTARPCSKARPPDSFVLGFLTLGPFEEKTKINNLSPDLGMVEPPWKDTWGQRERAASQVKALFRAVLLYFSFIYFLAS